VPLEASDVTDCVDARVKMGVLGFNLFLRQPTLIGIVAVTRDDWWLLTGAGTSWYILGYITHSLGNVQQSQQTTGSSLHATIGHEFLTSIEYYKEANNLSRSRDIYL